MRNDNAYIGIVGAYVLFSVSIVAIFFGVAAYTVISNSYPSPYDNVTILDKTSYDVSQGFFSSREGFFVITDKGNYEVGTTENSAYVYALYSRLKVGHKYNIKVSMGLIIGAEEVKER
jgi:hypothetical protein